MGKLPNGDRAFVDPGKISGYILNPHHRIGQHKARVFNSTLGLTPADAELLIDALKAAARTEDAADDGVDVFGARYLIEFELVNGPRSAGSGRRGL